MKKRRILSTILAVNLAITPLVGLAKQQQEQEPPPQPEPVAKEEPSIGGFLRLLMAFGPDIGSTVLDIIGLQELGKGLKKLITTMNEIKKEIEKKQITPESARKTIKLIAQAQQGSELIQKDIKKIAKVLAKAMKFFAWLKTKKQKQKLVTIKVKDEQGNFVDKQITYGEYLKNAPEYLVNVSFNLAEKWQNLVKKLLEKLVTRIEEMEKKEAEKKGITPPVTILPVETMKETIKTPTETIQQEAMEFAVPQ